ncbi:MAG: ribosome biogenesis GTPase YlqF [Defluviitaleaceae bacterium]|nr:ribosome biogenesis GTPase YlqF [Defluviitaleaceae bacterium]
MNHNIQWFPGHMVKARRQIEERIKLVDIVYEILDARIPYSSQNPLIKKMVGQKNRLVILNKTDLADPKVTQLWLEAFEKQGLTAIAIDSLHHSAKEKIVAKSKEMLAEKFAKEKAKGLRPRPIRAMIIGIPNAGKSTLINTLAKRKAAQAANRPGVTKAQQWIKVAAELELLDTPGMLWPKFESRHVGFSLALTGAIKDTILPLDDVSLYAVNYLLTHYQTVLIARYHLRDDQIDVDEPASILTAIGENRKFLVTGGDIDYDRVCETLIKEIRDVKLGRLSFETPHFIERLEIEHES